MESASDFWKKVIAGFISKVSGADFCFHIPATEGSRRKADASDFKSHIGDDWKGNPAEAKGVEARGVGVADGDLLGGFFWRWKKTRFFSGKRDDDGEKIEGSSFFRGFPAKAEAELGEVGFSGIA